MNNLFDPIPRALATALQSSLAKGLSPKGDAAGTVDQKVQPLSMHELATIAGGWGSIEPI